VKNPGTDRHDNPTRTWVIRRIALGLDQALLDYIQSHRARLHSNTDSELVRALLREHQMLSTEMAACREHIRALERRLERTRRK